MSFARTSTTLLVAALVFVVGLFVGFRLLTAKADTADAAAPTCTNRTLAEGDELTSNLVKVNVYNASTRSGLANRLTINLQRKNFLGGIIGNSTSAAEPGNVAILTDDKDDPRVELVAAQLKGKVTYEKPDIQVDGGVTVVVGDGYDDKGAVKKKAPTTVKTDRPITVCVTTVELP